MGDDQMLVSVAWIRMRPWQPSGFTSPLFDPAMRKWKIHAVSIQLLVIYVSLPLSLDGHDVNMI